MNHSVFAYPGNKSSLADWVVRHFPDHRLYVEVFGGAAGVLANKPHSYNEVYNDIDEELVQFFDVLRERDDELVEWLHDVPYARAKYDDWGPRWYDDGWRPEDPVRRAGVFFFLRCVSFGGTYQYAPGFATSVSRNAARTYTGQIERLHEWADRFQDVIVENLDWRECVDEYDTEETLFYLDPPYYDTRNRYRHGRGFDHDALAGVLANVDGRWIASYGTVPPSVQEQTETVVDRTVRYKMGAGYNGDSKDSTETLAMNYDPASTPTFVDEQHRQSKLAAPNGGFTEAIEGGDSP